MYFDTPSEPPHAGTWIVYSCLADGNQYMFEVDITTAGTATPNRAVVDEIHPQQRGS